MNFLSYSRRTHGFDSRLVCVSLASLLTLGATDAHGQTPSPVQSKARPFGLDIVAPVMAAGSDKASEVFQQNTLPELTSYLKATLSEQKGIASAGYTLDPSKLLLQTESDVRVYFIGEGAGYRNTLGFNTGFGPAPAEAATKASLESAEDTANNKGKGKGNDKEKDKDNDKAEENQEKQSDDEAIRKSLAAIGKDGRLIFPDASSPLSFFDPSADAARSRTAPLLPGDFVDLGRFDAGTQLDFFLIANGAAGGTTTFSTQTSLNADGIDHVVAFAYGLKDSPYILLGFEDLYGGGDQDYNDLLFAVDIGRMNLTALTATPEPSTYLVLGCLIPFGYYLKRRRDQQSAGTSPSRTP
jgi:hypothetical protein